MPQWVNFKELRMHLNFEDVFRHYGIEPRAKKNNQHLGPCPLPQHEGKKESASFSANLEKKIFQCFGCKGSGNILDFIALKEGLNPKNGDELRTAALLAQEKFFGIARETERPAAKPAQSELPLPASPAKPVKINAPLDFVLKGLDPTHPYLRERGFTAETIKQFGLGFCKRGYLAGRIAIPLHDAEGQLIGYAGRLVDDVAVSDENPKYRLPGMREHEGTLYEFRKTEFLYNGHRIKAPVDNLLVVEGFPSVWWLVQTGFESTVALMGADCSDKQAELIRSLLSPGGTLWIFTDGNEAGERCASEVFTKIAPHRFVRRVPLAKEKQPTDCTKEELALLLPLKGEKAVRRTRGSSIKMQLLTKEMTRRQAIVALAFSFPSLQDCGLSSGTWDADAFDDMVREFQGSKRFAAEFVLEVWNQEQDWKSGMFNVVEAMNLWDEAHRKAFLSWVSDSWSR